MSIKRVLRNWLQRLPKRYQYLARAVRYGRQQQSGRFVSPEPEFQRLSTLLGPGDWVLDVGANIGHYSRRMAAIVGPAGRVFAIEPVPETFALLAINVSDLSNVTCINAAASSEHQIVSMTVPDDRFGLQNQYRAHLGAGSLPVFCMALDALQLPQKVRLAKIDVEGHELDCLRGMQSLLRRDRPDLIIEGGDKVADFLAAFGYTAAKLDGSPNTIFSCPSRA
jgi:FkbM family methyltransferase